MYQEPWASHNNQFNCRTVFKWLIWNARGQYSCCYKFNLEKICRTCWKYLKLIALLHFRILQSNLGKVILSVQNQRPVFPFFIFFQESRNGYLSCEFFEVNFCNQNTRTKPCWASFCSFWKFFFVFTRINFWLIFDHLQICKKCQNF